MEHEIPTVESPFHLDINFFYENSVGKIVNKMVSIFLTCKHHLPMDFNWKIGLANG